MKLQSKEFEPRWVQLPSFIQIGQPEVGERARTPDRTTDRQIDTSTDNKGRLELSGAREPINSSMLQCVYHPTDTLCLVCMHAQRWFSKTMHQLLADALHSTSNSYNSPEIKTMPNPG